MATLINGTPGNDTLTGQNQDTLDGGAGDDLYRIDQGRRTIVIGRGSGPGTGSDTLQAASGASYDLQLGEGLDASDLQFVWTLDQPDGAGQWRLRISEGRGDILLATLPEGQGPGAAPPGLERILLSDGQAVAQTELTALLNDKVQAGVVLEGTSGNDVLRADVWQDNIVLGGAGDDTITTVFDGHHADTLKGGAGADVYVIEHDWGFDTISDEEGVNVVRFDATMPLSSLRFTTTDDDDLVIASGVVGIPFSDERIASNELRIEGFAKSPTEAQSRVSAFVFEGNGGLTLTAQDILDRLGASSSGADVLSGTSKDDLLDGGLGADHLFGHHGADSLHGGARPDYLDGGAGHDLLTGDDGDDTVEGGLGDDTLTGGRGNDKLHGGDGADTYVFNIGDGVDRLTESGEGNVDNDIVSLGAGIRPEDVTLYKLVRFDGTYEFGSYVGSLSIQLDGRPEGMFIHGQFEAGGSRGIEGLRFADGTTWMGDEFLAHVTDVSGNNGYSYYAGDGDTLTADGDNQFLMGEIGHAVFIVDESPFHTRVSLAASGELRMKGMRPEDVKVSWSPGYTVKLFYGVSTSVEIENAYLSEDPALPQRLTVTFDDGTVWSQADMFALSKVPQPPIVTGQAGDDTLLGGDGVDWLSDTLGGDNVFDGGAGDDNLNGAAAEGANTYVLRRGEGFDGVANFDPRKGDVLQMDHADLMVERFLDTEGRESLLKFRWMFGEGGAWVKLVTPDMPDDTVVVTFTDGTPAWTYGDVKQEANSAFGEGALMVGSDGDDEMRGSLLRGGAGNDTMQGSSYESAYLYGRGDGDDVVAPLLYKDGRFGDSYGDITLKFDAGIGVDDLMVRRESRTVLPDNRPIDPYTATTISFKGFEGSLDVVNLQRIEFADGTSLDEVGITELGLLTTPTGTADDDVLSGGPGDDAFGGLGGNDTLSGGAGADLLDGGEGSDTYLFRFGDGEDTLRDHDATGDDIDVLTLDDITSQMIWFTRVGDDLALSFLFNWQDKITVQDWFGATANRLERITTVDDGQVLTASRVDELVSAMARFSPADLGDANVGAFIRQTMDACWATAA